MMFPSIAPMVPMGVRIQEGKRANGQAPPFGAPLVFVGDYLISLVGRGRERGDTVALTTPSR